MSKENPWPILRFLHDEAVLTKTRNKLPHWQFENATVFLTFRLSDSIPADILHKWKAERESWILEHPRLWSTELEMEYHKRFSGAIDRYLDEGLGSCILRNPANAKIVRDAFQYFDQDRYLMHAWVIMPNHVHLLFSLKEDIPLDSIVTSWKRFTSRAIGNGPIWQRDLLRPSNPRLGSFHKRSPLHLKKSNQGKTLRRRLCPSPLPMVD